ncbi:MAG TPA: hypothetical protein VK448_07250 [Dissulfurispiraceae bacterium]|nr:hypothetical protein [Dissulfurispiraceae bacterium]
MTPVILIAAATVMAVIIIVPFRLNIQGAFDGRFGGDILITWLWGLASAEYTKSRGTISILLGKRRMFHFRPAASCDKKRKRSFRPFRPTADGTISFLGKLPSLIGPARKVWRSISPNGGIRLVLGLGDPAQTGLCAGVLASMLAALPLPISLEPDFTQERCVAEGILSLRIVIGSLLLIFVGLLLSRVRRILVHSSN